MVKVLGIDVDDALVEQWRRWYAPEIQPFFVETRKGLPRSLGGEFTPETRDSFRVWSPANRGKKVVWYDAMTAARAGLPFRTATDDDVIAFVEGEGIRHHPHQHAPRFAGTFPSGSGPNCFGAVMGAGGVERAEQEWMQQEPFEKWLSAHRRPGGADTDEGTVLMWRSAVDGLPFHAAISLGDGFAFEKPSQCWWAPWYVAPVNEIKRATRMTGIRLERWRLKA